MRVIDPWEESTRPLGPAVTTRQIVDESRPRCHACLRPLVTDDNGVRHCPDVNCVAVWEVQG